MKFKIPFVISNLDKVKKKSRYFLRFVKHKHNSQLQNFLDQSGTGLRREEYLAICYKKFIFSLAILFIISTTSLAFMRISNFLLYSSILSIMFSGFILFSMLAYPKIYASKREKNIERNLIPGLEDILVQLTSGIPLFSIMANISSSDYGELSEEFRKIVRQINAGLPEEQVLEEVGEKSTSIFFRRTLWQIANGMKSGADLSTIIKSSIKALNEEQLIQIQNYGNKLNPMIMFYMMVSVILPALGITFLTIISSVISLPKTTAIFFYVVIFIAITFIQIMFLGILRSIRPSLL